ncbi:MAG: peptide ABC transporter permease [Candidatus Adiutrix intracellularis]|jgi:peptide/nickel transport system permease protein|nr:MAG: peptide ABC transporter permease [Candidatus Adiutrix intracellularis]MDR2827219.1 ABC transporter permease [Candidatus Adiutrix intracellularis]
MNLKLFLTRFAAQRLALIGAILVILMFMVSAAAGRLAPYDPNHPEPRNRLSPPSSGHILGTDALGRDVLSRLIWGSQVSLKVGFVAVGLTTTIGLLLGTAAGYYGGMVDDLIMIFCDLMLCFPSMFLILAVIAMLEPSIWNVMIVIGLTSWMGVARLVRAEFITLKNQDFTLAARALGASDLRLILYHLLPNALAPVLVSATLGVAGAILLESSLSFLGLGVQPPTATWGVMLADGKDYIDRAWWLSFYPGLAILITVLSYNLVGEGLRDALDPRN